MSISKNVQMILNGTIASLTTVIPVKLEVLAPTLTVQPYEQKEISVLIGIVGGIKGRLIIDTSTEVINTVGQAMFGMAVEGEMIESFTGELGNMVAGNLCTVMEKEGLLLDISPPTVMTGQTKLFGFKKAFKLPVRVSSAGMITVLLTIDEVE
ncbi:chemotaxis protein CheX [Filibacter tadaridae]|uniref:CheY-P phosphatase CheX n=1 Tax=Filibacter tadaridae TaxID=2483811 RepID=A0A3P5XJX4_9BACL|nr:chemotaxis protein CheX [Filibacter tadaridae]VDC29101.1 CheY-P phosphatase CheX [Filibacter tadaridae]